MPQKTDYNDQLRKYIQQVCDFTNEKITILGKKIGGTQSTLQKFTRGERNNISASVINALGDYTGYYFDEESLIKVKVPIKGHVSAGYLEEAIEGDHGFIYGPAEEHGYYALIVDGDSMNKTIKPGSKVVFMPALKNPEAADKAIVHAQRGDEAKLKRYYADGHILVPESTGNYPVTPLSDGWEICGIAMRKIESLQVS